MRDMITETIGSWTIEGDEHGVMVTHRSGASASVQVAEMVGVAEDTDRGGERRIPRRVVRAALAMEAQWTATK